MSRSTTIGILTYHSLDESGSVLSIPPQLFAEHMQILHDQGVRVVPLDEIRRVLSCNALSEHVVAITFDDGFRSVYEYALPVLQRCSFTATVFLVTDFCDRTNSWPSQPGYIEHRPLLRWAEVREMSAAGITFGTHTRTHPDLMTLPIAEVEEELVSSKKAIEDAIGHPVDTLAYPYGTYDDTVRRVAERYFTLACSTKLGFVTSGSDAFALERLDMYYLRRPMAFRRLFSREVDLYICLRRVARDFRGRVSGWINGSISRQRNY